MSRPEIRLTLDAAAAHYEPGDQLSGRFVAQVSPTGAIRSAELSVLWYTAGKGEEDFAVHHFERLVAEAARPLDLRVPRRFATVLPHSPLSYDGQILKVCWCVRLRLFLQHGQEAVAETSFRLGNVLAAAPAGEPRLEVQTVRTS